MKLTVEQKDLAGPLSRVWPAVAKRGGALPALHFVRLYTNERLHVAATDLDLGIDIKTQIEPPLPFDVFVAAKTFKDILGGWPKTSEIELSINGSTKSGKDAPEVRLTVGRASAVLPTLPMDDGWKAPPLRTEDTWEMPHEWAMAARLARVNACKDDARPILTGVFFDAKGWVAATDSYTLYAREFAEGAPPQPFLVPGWACAFLPEVGGGSVEIGTTSVGWQSEDAQVQAGRIQGEFPNFKQLIPSMHPNVVKVDRDQLIAALARVIRFITAAGETHRPCHLHFLAGELVVQFKMMDGGIGSYEEAMDTTRVAKHRAFELSLGINPWYLKRVLGTLQTPLVDVHYTDALKPLMLTDEANKALIMPVRMG